MKTWYMKSECENISSCIGFQRMTIQHYTGACVLKGDGIRLLLQTSWILDNPLVTALTFWEMPMPTGSWGDMG